MSAVLLKHPHGDRHVLMVMWQLCVCLRSRDGPKVSHHQTTIQVLRSWLGFRVLVMLEELTTSFLIAGSASKAGWDDT